MLKTELDSILNKALGEVVLTCSNCRDEVYLSTKAFCRTNEGVIPGNLRGMAYKNTADGPKLHLICTDERCACQRWIDAKKVKEANARVAANAADTSL